MNNLIISTIRFGALALMSFLAFAGEVFAAPALTPPTAFDISKTSATLSVKAVNPVGRSTTVWLEWGTTPYPTTVIGMRDIWSEGYTEGYLRGNLQPDTTYYFRGGAMEGGVTVYTPVMSFTTKGDTVTTNTTIVNNTSVTNTSSVNTTNTTSQTQTNTGTKKVATTQAPAKQVAVQTGTKNVSVNTASGQSAAVINTEGIFPGTLIGWVALLISLLLVALIGHMIYEQAENRKKKPNPHEDETDEA